jgi:5-methylcytosine-specific restriction endonuclease McrA
VQNEKLDGLKAEVAGYKGESRKIAALIKKQLTIDSHCPYCNRKVNAKEVHADHIYPISKGGRSVSNNMVMVCKDCNAKKKDKTIREFIKEYGLDRHLIEENLERLGKSF